MTSCKNKTDNLCDQEKNDTFDDNHIDIIGEMKSLDNIDLPYEQIIINAVDDSQIEHIITDPTFWEVKANQEFDVSPYEFRNTTLDPINRYLFYYNYADRYNDSIKKSFDPYYLDLIKESYDQLMFDVKNSLTLHLTLSDPTFWFLKANYDFNTSFDVFYDTDNPSEYRYLEIRQQL